MKSKVIFMLGIIVFSLLVPLTVYSSPQNTINYFTFMPIGTEFIYNITSVGNQTPFIIIHRYITVNATWLGQYFEPHVHIVLNDSTLPKPFIINQTGQKELLLINVLSDIGVYQIATNTLSFGYFTYQGKQIPVVMIRNSNETEYISLEYGIPLYGYGIIGNNRFNFNLMFTNLTFNSYSYHVYNISYSLNVSKYKGYILAVSPDVISASFYPVYFNMSTSNGHRIVGYTGFRIIYHGFLALFIPTNELSLQFSTIGVMYFNSSRYYAIPITSEDSVEYANFSNPFILYPFFENYYALFSPYSGNLTIVFSQPFVIPISSSINSYTSSSLSTIHMIEIGVPLALVAIIVIWYYFVFIKGRRKNNLKRK